MEDERVHKGLVGNKVLVELRSEKGGTYSVVARLRGKSDESLRLKLQASRRTVTVPRESVAGIRPLGNRRG